MTKSKEEIKTLISIAEWFGLEPDADLVRQLKEIEKKEATEADFKQKLLESAKKNIQNDIKEIFKPPAKTETPNPPAMIVEQIVIPEPPPVVSEPSLIDKAASEITKAEKVKESISPFTPPTPPPVSQEFASVIKKLKFLEEWIQKISVTGPGSGAAEIYNLDMPAKLVTEDYYVQRKDYYVGVNCDVKCNIYLPSDGNNLKTGRVIVIKDESGHAQLTPIKIVGTIDNDPDGAELRINNGAVTLLYRDGWRIF